MPYSRVMVTTNLWFAGGFVNGTIGTVHMHMPHQILLSWLTLHFMAGNIHCSAHLSASRAVSAIICQHAPPDSLSPPQCLHLSSNSYITRYNIDRRISYKIIYLPASM